MSATCCIILFAGTKNDYPPQYNIPPVRKLLPFRLRRLQNLRIVGNPDPEGVGG
jgi:hypothetical protein